MKLVELIPKDAIVSNLRAEDRDSAIMELLEALEGAGCVKKEHREDIVLALLKREAVATTALGHGVAIPHAKTKWVPNFCGALGIAKDGIDFGAVDRQPVTVCFLFLSPEHAISGHLQLMAHIAGLARNAKYVSLLRSARNAKELEELLANCEKIIFGAPEAL
ncbi:MAG TPA: PTS sugar transporter subunit IIA [Planctomycetota bacterium]|nr:PTS sugar transporter subunit IIA [Planctomycetota bacterium]